MIAPGDTVTSTDERDEPGAWYVVEEAGVPHVSGDAAKIRPAMGGDSVYRLERNLEAVPVGPDGDPRRPDGTRYGSLGGGA